MARMATPAAPSTPPVPSLPVPTPASDEISLRDVYLVLRRRAPWIVGAAVLAGVLGYVALTTRPAAYVAEASVTVARVPVTVGGDDPLAFRPQLDVTFEAYRALAYRASVLEQVRAEVPNAPFAPSEAEEVLTLERRAGAENQASALLVVRHRAEARDAAIAAALATAWARATAGAVRAQLTDGLVDVARVTSAELEAAQTRLAAADAALLAFRQANEATADPQRLLTARQRAARLVERRGELERQIAARQAELAALTVRSDLDTLVVLSESPDVSLTVAGAVAALESRLAGLRAELATLADQAATGDAEIARLAADVARVESTVADLARAVARAEAEAAALATIEPSVAYVAQLAPSGVRVLSDAVVPTEPEGRPTLLVALLAALVVGFAGVVLALLAEAVRDPRTPVA